MRALRPIVLALALLAGCAAPADPATPGGASEVPLGAASANAPDAPRGSPAPSPPSPAAGSQPPASSSAPAKERLPPPDRDLDDAIVADHGAPYLHAVPALHGSGYRMDLVGYDPLTRLEGGDDLANQNSAWGSVTLHGHVACVSHFAGGGGVGGATLVDVEDPAEPRVLASIVDGMAGSRCAFTEDGRFLLLGGYGGANPGVVAIPGTPAPAQDAAGYGIAVYDVDDPAAPKFLVYSTTGAESMDPSAKVSTGPYHNFWTLHENGTNFVYQSFTGNILALAPDGRSLEVVGTLAHSYHDFWVGPHPVTRERMLVTGAARGTAFFRLDDPTAPTLLGVWEPGEGQDGWHRQWVIRDPVEGRALVVVAGENCNTGETLPYTILDWTDPENVETLGSWSVPGDPTIHEPGQFCSMSPHEFTEWNGYVASANYHAGVWIFDVGTLERARAPVTIGYFEPQEDPRAHGGTRNVPFAWAPWIWSAVFDDRGYVLAADMHSGFYVLSFGATLTSSGP